jgi:hypothetical protein
MNPLDDDAHPPGASLVKLTADDGLQESELTALGDEKQPLLSSPLPSPSRPAPIPKKENEEDFITKVLQFLSTATPGTLGGVAVGLSAITYFILGKLGLVLIGAFGGIVLFISYQARHPEVSRAVRGETGFEVLQRLMLELKKDASELVDDYKEDEQAVLRSFDDFRPETREAMTALVDAVIRDYVKWWYSPILPTDHSFPLASRRVLSSFLLSVSNHLSRKRPADAFLDFLTNASSMVIVFLSELSSAFSEVPADSNMTAVDAVYSYLASNTDSNLANLLNQRQQAAKFRMVAEDLLAFLDRSTHDCDPARVFLREILAGVIMEMTLKSCSKPEWINGWIVYLLEAGEPDFSQAIDVGMQTGPDMNNNTFSDLDGNVGSIAGAKSSRNSLDMEKNRRKETMTHKKKLSRADEEMDEAMQEMKRMNRMIAEEEARQMTQEQAKLSEPPEVLTKAIERTAHELEGPGRASTPGDASPRSQSSLEKPSLDGSDTRVDGLHSPITPRSTVDLPSQNSSPKQASKPQAQFTSFDQIVPPAQDEPDPADSEPRKVPLTLHNATVMIHDDAVNDKGKIRNKPNWEYLMQIEPASSQHPGWMTIRKYSDFETLHEVLRRIATISGATAFKEQHSALPNWKMHTRASLRGELERYVRDACWYQALAESEGMRRFLEKESGHAHSNSKSGFGLESIGKNMLDVLTIAPKGAMEGGKAVVGGVTGVLGNIGIGPRKNTAGSLQDIQNNSSRLPPSSLQRTESLPSPLSKMPRDSLDSQRSSVISMQPGKNAPMERRPSYNSTGEADPENLRPRSDRWDRASPSARGSREHSRASSLAPIRSPSTTSLDATRLPPPPNEVSDDCESPTSGGDMQSKLSDNLASQRSSFTSPTPDSSFSGAQAAANHAKMGSTAGNGANGGPGTRPIRQFSQLTEQETRVAIELVFAIINEMYTLSSAWNFRRTLLAAAKSFLLRPGNPSLVSIQSLMQQSVLEANTSDAGIAAHLHKLRENSMPTEEELATWPAEMSQEEKENLRIKARKLLIQSGVPAALTGVMGQAATTDALGRVFDCLQIEEVARGLIFGMMLQAVRVITH